MRIITGTRKGRKLLTLDGDATRPTSERAKEAVFSMIQFSLEGRRVLDLYAGSGQMCLEALSRGAVSAVAVDSSSAACGVIRKNAALCRFENELAIIPDKLPGALRRLSGRTFDVVFIDPPYALGLIPGTLRALLREKLVSAYGYIVCESGAPGDVFGGDAALESEFSVLRQARYGAAYITLMHPAARTEDENGGTGEGEE